MSSCRCWSLIRWIIRRVAVPNKLEGRRLVGTTIGSQWRPHRVMDRDHWMCTATKAVASATNSEGCFARRPNPVTLNTADSVPQNPVQAPDEFSHADLFATLASHYD